LGTTLFLIKWLGYDPKFNSWEPEENLVGSEELLIKYKSSKDLPHQPFAEMDFLDEGPATANSIDTARVLVYISTISRFRGYKRTIEVVGFVDHIEDKVEKIYVLLHRSHFFVIAHYSSRRTIVVDGANATDDGQLKDELEVLVGLKLEQVRFEQQRGSDHCGASAIVIALELMRLHNRDQSPQGKLTVPDGTLKFLVGKLHRAPTEKLGAWKSVNEIEIPTCSKCLRKFKRTGRKAMLIHEHRCKMRR